MISSQNPIVQPRRIPNQIQQNVILEPEIDQPINQPSNPYSMICILSSGRLVTTAAKLTKHEVRINLNINCDLEALVILKKNKKNKNNPINPNVRAPRLPVARTALVNVRTIPSVLNMRIVYIAVNAQRIV